MRNTFLIFLLISNTSSAQITDSVKVVIKGLGKILNSPFDDFAPVISADGTTMIFTSRRPASEREIKKNKESIENIYISEYNARNRKWSEGKLLSSSVNQIGRNNSAIALSNDGQTLLIYRDDNYGNGDIFQSKLEGNEWTEPIKLPEPINTSYHESSASISPDGRTIYFCSNRPGGYGGRDIWYCKQDGENNWSQAINLGEVINTTEDEEGIFMHPDGTTLFFCSKGFKTTLDYDIYSASFVDGKWTAPLGMPSPINTTEADLFFVLTADGKTGYYTSAKEGGFGGKDIYEIRFTSLRKKKDKGPKLTLFKGVVMDKITLDSLGADIEIMDNEKNEILSRITSNSATGYFLVSLPPGKNYGINVKKNGYLFYSDNITIPDTSAYKEIIKDVLLEKLNIGSKIILRNIFYDFDKSTLRSESLGELDQLVHLMNENPSLKIELSSHTDNRGSDQYNMKLSQTRAQSVVNYLLEKGIHVDRLSALGYGESQAISTNETEDGRQMNRRTEFKILDM